MAFKQSLKGLKNKKIIFIKEILKLECLFYQNIYKYYFILFYIRGAILTLKKSGSLKNLLLFIKRFFIYESR